MGITRRAERSEPCRLPGNRYCDLFDVLKSRRVLLFQRPGRVVLIGEKSVTQTSQIDRYSQAISWIYGRLNYERTPDAAASLLDFKLVRMEDLLTRLGHPERQLPTVHIAGSKGKGSTATMVAAIGEAAGLKVGLFTSPHVDQFEERFTINGGLATAQELIDLVDVVRPVVEAMDQQYSGQGVTFFELATAISWMHFARNHVDLAVIEVGLGGRLDSTNVCQPIVTAITSISRDHTRLLGETLPEIAREKAGIIKLGVPVVTAVSDAGAIQTIAEIAAANHASLFRLGQEFHSRPRPGSSSERASLPFFELDFESPQGCFEHLQLAMPGEHQTRNAAVAIQIVQLLNERGFVFSEAHIRDGLKRAVCSLRIQVMGVAPLRIVDAAHNEASITALCDTLKAVDAGQRTLIFATSRDKEVATLLSILDPNFDRIVLTRYSNNPRAVPISEFEELAPKILKTDWSIAPDPETAWNQVMAEARPNDLICVTGSFFLAAEVRNLLQSASVGSD